HTFTQSFLLPVDLATTSRDLAAGWIKTNTAGGNVKIQALLQAGQTANKRTTIPGTSINTFTSSDPDAHVADDATQFYISQTGSFVNFVSLVNAYNGASVPNVTAANVGTPTQSGSFQVQITRNGSAAE